MQGVALRAGRGITGAIAEVLVKGSVISLNSRCRVGVAQIYRGVDDIETRVPLIQSQLIVGTLGFIPEIDSAPFDVEDTVRRVA